MFSRAATTFFYASVAFGLLAAATPNPGEKRWGTPTKTVTVTPPASTATEPASDCGTGKLQCCNSVQSSKSAAGSVLLGLVQVVLQGPEVLLGGDCSPISVIGVGGNSACDAHPVCCENNSFGTLISIGCVPVSL